MTWQLSKLTRSFRSSQSLLLTQPHSQSNKYWLFQSLCLSVVLSWQSKQLDCYSTAFHPDKSCLHPQASVCTYSYIVLSPCGGPSTLQRTACGSSSGVTSSHSPAEQDRTCQCQGNTCWRLGVSDLWFGLSEWISERVNIHEKQITARINQGRE